MEKLYQRVSWLVDASWFEKIMSLIIFMNPVALFPQVIVAFTASSVEGIALHMWYLFALIQTAFVFHGIKTKSLSVFLSMLISVIESLAIIIIVTMRG